MTTIPHLAPVRHVTWPHPTWCSQQRCDTGPLDANHLSALTFDKTLDEHGDTAAHVAIGRDDDVDHTGTSFVQLGVTVGHGESRATLDLAPADAIALAAALTEAAQTARGLR